MISLDIALRIPTLHVAAAAGAVCFALTLPLVTLADEAKPASPMTHYEFPKAAPQESEVKVAEQPDTADKAPEFSPRGTFSSICGLCHQDGGRKQGAGPQLMDNPKTDEELFNKIKFGKPGQMAAFGSVFTDDQIRQLVAYIRSLKPR
jgi:mono/diheme cytochrome c family protein